MESFEDLAKKAKIALVIGIGGGGDIVGAIPTANYLNSFGVKTMLGGLTWERMPIDPQPGPRKIEEIINFEPISETVIFANSLTRTKSGVQFAASRAAELLSQKTILIDINQGVQGVVNGLNKAAEKLNLDLIVGVDVGGDSIARGIESTLKSPIADSTMVSALAQLKVPTILGVIGLGCDGELTNQELLNNIAHIIEVKGYLGAHGLDQFDLPLLEKLVKNIPTEVSALVVEAARGKVGRFEIRSGTRSVDLTPIAVITFYFNPKVIFERHCLIAKKIANITSLEEVNNIIVGMGLRSELDFEKKQAKKLGFV